MLIIELIIVLIFLIIFSIFSYKKQLLDFEGILIANAVGLAAITYGLNPLLDFLAVVIFFILGEIVSNFPKKKHGKRGIWNVVGNSLPALAILSLILIYPEYSFLFEDVYGKTWSSFDINKTLRASNDEDAWVKAEELMDQEISIESDKIISINRIS